MLFAELSARLRVNEPNLPICAPCTKIQSKLCATFHLAIFPKVWYYILVKRTRKRKPHQSECGNGNKKFLKIFKKSLDKIPLMWYNKYVVKREKQKPSQSEFGNGNKKTLDK